MAIDLSTKQKLSTYTASHMWMRYHFGKPQHCEHCNTTEKRMYHWANVSGTYARDRSDWLRLCVPCHKSYDIKALGGKIKARGLKTQPSKICAECNVEFFKKSRLSKAQWDAMVRCSKTCAALYTGRMLKGTTQSEATRALKSEKLAERWQRPEWRERMAKAMAGNQYARKQNVI